MVMKATVADSFRTHRWPGVGHMLGRGMVPSVTPFWPTHPDIARFARYLVYDSETMRYGARWGVQAFPGWHVVRGGPLYVIMVSVQGS